MVEIEITNNTTKLDSLKESDTRALGYRIMALKDDKGNIYRRSKCGKKFYLSATSKKTHLTPREMVESLKDSEIFKALYWANLTNVSNVALELSFRGYPTAESGNGYTDDDERFYHTLLKERLDRLCANGEATKAKGRDYQEEELYCLYTGKEYLEE